MVETRQRTEKFTMIEDKFHRRVNNLVDRLTLKVHS